MTFVNPEPESIFSDDGSMHWYIQERVSKQRIVSFHYLPEENTRFNADERTAYLKVRIHENKMDALRENIRCIVGMSKKKILPSMADKLKNKDEIHFYPGAKNVNYYLNQFQNRVNMARKNMVQSCAPHTSHQCPFGNKRVKITDIYALQLDKT